MFGERIEAKPNLLVVDVEVDIEEVPEAKQGTELQGLEQATRFGFLAGGFGHRSRLNLETVRSRIGITRQRRIPRPKFDRRRRRRRRRERPGSASREIHIERIIVEVRRRRSANGIESRVEAQARRLPSLL